MASDITVLCLSCNRPTRQDIVYVTMWLGAQLNIVEGVPAHVCDHCGVQYYEPEIEQKLRALNAAGFPQHLQSDTYAVPVFHLDKVDLSDSALVAPRVMRG